MKTYFKRVFISGAMLFLLLALIAPAISALSYTAQGPISYSDPNKVDSLQPVYEPPTEPKPDTQANTTEEPTPDVPQEKEEPTPDIPQEKEEPAADIPQEEEPAAPEPIEPEIDYPNGKSNSRGKGIFHKSAKKSK